MRFLTPLWPLWTAMLLFALYLLIFQLKEFKGQSEELRNYKKMYRKY